MRSRSMPRIAGEEVDLVAGLQRQQVVRMSMPTPQERPARLVPAALDQMADRGEMPLLAPGPAMRRGRGVGSARGLDARRLGAEQVSHAFSRCAMAKSGLSAIAASAAAKGSPL